jgi:hypothetical protein
MTEKQIFVIPTTRGLAVAKAVEEMEEEKLLIEAIEKLRSLNPIIGKI